jgi:uncharacterized protein YuzE
MTTKIPHVRHDTESDAIYVRLNEGTAARTRALDDLRLVDVAEDGTIIGVEFLDVSGGIDLDAEHTIVVVPHEGNARKGALR